MSEIRNFRPKLHSGVAGMAEICSVFFHIIILQTLSFEKNCTLLEIIFLLYSVLMWENNLNNGWK